MQFRDLKKQYTVLKSEIDKQIAEVIESGQFILGPKVLELEKELAEFTGVKHCIACANGTDAITLPLMAWGVGAGDAVFTSDFTFFASAGAAEILGATAILADIDPRTFNISPIALEAAIQKVLSEGKLTPKAIITVDLFGLPADYTAIKPITDKYGLRILEDAAQSFGAELNGKRACSFGDAATTSFFPAKPLGCYGDGGAIFTDEDELAITLRSLRTQGSSPADKYDNRQIGMNSRLDPMQAGILLSKFHAFKTYEIDDVNKVAGWYTERLKDLVETPYIPEGYRSVWAQYTILLPDNETRNKLQQHLKDKNIPTMVYYPKGMHRQTAFADRKLKDEDFPNTNAAAERVLSLPMHPYLSEDDVGMICKEIRAFLGK
jgi:dTDP-4-amino-4,6-dideoxygalactose transaminase